MTPARPRRLLKSLAVGDEFEWCNVKFRLDSLEPQSVSHDERPYLNVTYLQCDRRMRNGKPAFHYGDKGLMPADEDLDGDSPW